MKNILIIPVIFVLLIMPVRGQFESDVVKTSEGDLEMYFIGHSTLLFTLNDLVIHIDPVTREAIYDNMPDADLILITHEHGDHFDMRAIDQIMKEDTRVVMTQLCQNLYPDFKATVMRNGDTATICGVGIEALPAYNIIHREFKWKPYHSKGEGNAYLLTIGDKRILIGGDTENIPELKALRDIQVAYLPMDVPFTMTPEMVEDLAKAIRPEILYPYHYVNTNPERLVELLKKEKDIEVRIRDLR